MAVAAPVVEQEMADWVALGGGNSGIVGNKAHTYGAHLGANEIPASDYTRWRDPNGADGPYVDWSYAVAGDFSHRNDERLRAMHRAVLARLMAGQLPMICEFIGKPWADRPVYYWARWNGVTTLLRYTGAGHDHWSHIAWFRSMVDQLAGLWRPAPSTQEDDMPMYGVSPGDATVWAGDGVQCRPVKTEEGIVGGFNAVVSYPTRAALFDRLGVPVSSAGVDVAALAKATAAEVAKLGGSGNLPPAVVDTLAKLGAAADAVVAAARK